MSPMFEDLVARQQRRLAVIWAVFIAATVIYAGLGAVIARRVEPSTVAPVSRVPIVVGVATGGLAIAAAGAAAGRRLLGQALQGKSIGYAPRPRLPGADAELSETERYLVARIPAYQAVMIITWASYEAAAVVGLVLAIVLGDLVPAVIGSVVALAMLAPNRPQLAAFLAECDRWRRLHQGGEDRR